MFLVIFWLYNFWDCKFYKWIFLNYFFVVFVVVLNYFFVVFQLLLKLLFWGISSVIWTTFLLFLGVQTFVCHDTFLGHFKCKIGCGYNTFLGLFKCKNRLWLQYFFVVFRLLNSLVVGAHFLYDFFVINFIIKL